MTALILAACWALGIAVGLLVEPGMGGLAAVAALVAGLAAWLAGPGVVRLVGAAGCVLLLGLARVASGELTVGSDELSVTRESVTLLGQVADSPAPVGQGVRFELDVLELRTDGGESRVLTAPARVQVRAFGIRASADYGDRVSVRGRIAEPRSRPGYPLAEILARRGITRVVDATSISVSARAEAGPARLLRDLRRHLVDSLRAALPEPHASLTAGIVLGTREGTPPELRSALTATGTSHIVAVSGFNVAITAALVEVIAVRLLGRQWALLPMLLAVWGYTLLVGAPPSALRAAAMVSLTFAARAVGRLPDPITTLALAAAALVGWEPRLLLDLGFQLSVLATAGLVLLTAPIADRLGLLPRSLRNPLAVALAAQVATLPIILATFHTLSVVAPLANVLIGPAVPAVMLVGGLLALLEPLPGLSSLLAWLTWALVGYVLAVIDWTASLPSAVIFTGRLPSWAVAWWYALLALAVAAGSPEVRARLGPRRPLGLGLATATLALLPVSTVLAVPAGERLEVSFLDVDEPAIFVRGPSGRTVLAGGASAGGPLAASIADRLGFWERGLDLVVITDTSQAQLGGPADALRRYPPRTALVPARGGPGLAGSSPGGVVMAEAGQRVDLGGGAWLEVVDVRDHDGRGVVDVRVVLDDVAVWLPGPGSPSARWRLAAEESRSVLLRLPTPSGAWLRAAPAVPWLAIVADGPLQAPVGDAVPVLDRPTYGAVEAVLSGEADATGWSLRTERCPSGRACLVTP